MAAKWLALLAPLAGLELATASILLALLESNDAALEAELDTLARLAGLSSSNVRRLTLHLAKLGWIDLEPLPDERLKICLTETGYQFAFQLL